MSSPHPAPFTGPSPRRRREKTDITLWDRVRFEQELLSRPAFVLRRFRSCQVSCLIELPTFLKIVSEQPEAAIRIAFIAATMGIPIGDEAL